MDEFLTLHRYFKVMFVLLTDVKWFHVFDINSYLFIRVDKREPSRENTSGS